MTAHRVQAPAVEHDRHTIERKKAGWVGVCKGCGAETDAFAHALDASFAATKHFDDMRLAKLDGSDA